MLTWKTLCEIYRSKDLGNKTVRYDLIKDFEKVSRNFWQYTLETNDTLSVANSLTQAWCCDIKFDSEQEAAEEAVSYMWYASDRMDVNRWLRIRILLNYSVH